MAHVKKNHVFNVQLGLGSFRPLVSFKGLGFFGPPVSFKDKSQKTNVESQKSKI